ncbi:MAG: valine--tRNA ligase [Lachnospiraceae bacterium]|nr:valine--tRNA ligase [Lachnospiraceae bacterium]
MKELEKNYNPKTIEDRIYKKWEDSSSFVADPNSKKKPYTIIMPPPNITGKLHMGHALDISLQDTLIRYKRMKGYEALWQPGTDHAAISTEVKVVEKLNSEGKDKYTLGRDAFMKEAWAWKEKFENNIIEQQKKMGASCDWSKLRFTMDEGCSHAVFTTFKELYDKGLIYKGKRIINWCPTCHTTISDAEVEYEEQDGALYHIRYYFEDENIKINGKNYIVVATTRPETMLGDTAVAVNPDDTRYKDIVGKILILPLVGRKLEIIADSYVDMEFGTGFVKMTPCHDPNDFEVGHRHNLEEIQILDDDAHIVFEGSVYHGLDRIECRKKIVEDLKLGGFIEKIEPYKHNVGTHDRCHTNIEPMIKDQWFVKMEPLAKPAIDVIKDGRLKFVPESFTNTYLHWLMNIKDWCISRQIWWGHRIPVYYCKDCGHMTIGEGTVNFCEKCHSTNIYQDEDTLDTWFSSALWPFSTLGWPDQNDMRYKYFYPTDVLVTGYDIIFFWVIRMVFSGLEQTGVSPFSEVLIHGIVRDDQGRKMSKSLGNGIDPLDVVEKYGADALRLSLLTGNAPGNDMRFYESRVEAGRNFLNKVWNATRFIMMNDKNESTFDPEKIESITDLRLEDKWIITKLNIAIKEITANIEKYELGIALEKIQKFVWEEFCDWYIEFKKDILYNGDEKDKETTVYILKYVLYNSLKLLHPFCPFVTEDIYDNVFDSGLLISSSFPEYKEKLSYEKEKNALEYIKVVISSIRNRRSELNVSKDKKPDIIVASNSADIIESYKLCERYIKTLALVNGITYVDRIDSIDKYITLTFENSNIYILFSDLVDIDKEKDRIKNEIAKVESEIKRAKGMLGNQKFVEKAPKEKIEEEKEKLKKYEQMLLDLNNTLAKL